MNSAGVFHIDMPEAPGGDESRSDNEDGEIHTALADVIILFAFY